MSGLQLLNQELDIGGDKFLFGAGGLPVVRYGLVVDSGCVAHGVDSFASRLWLLHVRVERGMYMPNATWRRRG
jgi:hypothetical protein